MCVFFQAFEKNPYFPNKALWKEFKYNADGEVKVTCGSINWNKGKNPLQKEEKKAPAGKKAGQKRGLEDSEEDEEDTSFFAWFSPEAIDEESDSTLGELIRDEIWTNPFTYFHSIDSDEEDDEEGDEDDDEEEEGDE